MNEEYEGRVNLLCKDGRWTPLICPRLHFSYIRRWSVIPQLYASYTHHLYYNARKYPQFLNSFGRLVQSMLSHRAPRTANTMHNQNGTPTAKLSKFPSTKKPRQKGNDDRNQKCTRILIHLISFEPRAYWNKRRRVWLLGLAQNEKKNMNK